MHPKVDSVPGKRDWTALENSREYEGNGSGREKAQVEPPGKSKPASNPEDSAIEPKQ